MSCHVHIARLFCSIRPRTPFEALFGGVAKELADMQDQLDALPRPKSIRLVERSMSYSRLHAPRKNGSRDATNGAFRSGTCPPLGTIHRYDRAIAWCISSAMETG